MLLKITILIFIIKNILFTKKCQIWTNYITLEALFLISQVEIISKDKFVKII